MWGLRILKRTKAVKAFITAAVLLPITFAGPVLAHDQGAHHGRHAGMMQRLDANKDGAVDKAEFVAARADRFSRLDADGDGQIAKADFVQAVEQARAARRAERLQKAFSRADANGDGVLTRDEYLARTDEVFGRMDRDGSGTLTGADRAMHRGNTSK